MAKQVRDYAPVENFRASRYARVAPYRRKVYAPSEAWSTEPVREELVLGRRYTSWEVPTTGAFTRRVMAGETVFSIAASVYGDSKLWYLVLDYNPQILDPFAIQEGEVLQLGPAPLGSAVSRW